MSMIPREEIRKYVFTSLGYPIVNVELSQLQLDVAIDQALNEYLSTGAFETSYVQLPVNNSSSNVFDIPEDAATVKNVVFNIPFETAAGSTQDIFSFAVYASPFGPNYTNFVHAAGNLGVFFEYLQNRNRAIGNTITFKVVNNQLYVWPLPRNAPSILIEYSKNAFGVEDKDENISLSNSWGINWIRKYALAVSKGMLGKVRGKFSQVSGGPGNESQTLNAAELVAESKEEIAALMTDLFERKSHIQFFLDI
jgi:hypothetical protein